ncbi:MAG: heat-inducible transcriptional repressor HrcA [Nitrospinota bacterium]
MHPTLGARDSEILRALISHHIRTAEPVGSRALSKYARLSLSAASIRNVMADLGERGYLSQPHTSAGRVPTDLGYRVYVDSLMETHQLTEAESWAIERAYAPPPVRPEDLLVLSSRLLSHLTNQAGLVLIPNLAQRLLRHMEFIAVGPRQVLALLVADRGLVHSRTLAVEEEIPQETLDRISRYLNEEFSGITLHEIRHRLVEGMGEDKLRFDALFYKAMDLSCRAFAEEESSSEEVYVEGASSVLDQPEFAEDVERMRAIFRTLEDKSRLVRILDRCMDSRGVLVVIGSENRSEDMEGLSLVAHNYSCGNRVLGSVGIVGPKRMEYPRMVALVAHTAGVLSQALSRQA